MNEKRPGRIVTFYSYKGGTGRSMTLANVAWVLASSGQRVLAIDWDLEAPGLHRYFRPFLVDRDLISSEGVIDFVIDFATEAMTPAPEGETIPEDWYRAHADITQYASSLEWRDWEFPNGGTLDFVSAGRQGASYSTRVNTFDWSRFYERQGGGVFLEAACEMMREEYDFILVDSRTGVSDTSGICTVQMPDDLVVCFTLNNQGIEGAAAVAASAYAQRSSSGLRIFPVPMRIELSEKDKLEARQALARKRFALFPDHMDSAGREQYWDAVGMLYIPYYAYEEVLAPFGDASGRPTTLLGAIERLVSYLTDGKVQKYEPVPESMRQEVLQFYAGKEVEETPLDEASRLAEKVYLQLASDQQAVVRRLFTRMVRLARPEERSQDVAAPLALSEVPGAREAVRPFVAAELVVCQPDPVNREDIAQWVEPLLIEHWPRLQAWIAEDREFLLWRQKLRAQQEDWLDDHRADGSLLRGNSVLAARRWRAERPEELSLAEQTYIEKSLAAATRRHRQRIAAAAAILLVLSLLIAGGVQITRVNREREANKLIHRGDELAQSGELSQARDSYTKSLDLEPSEEALLGRAAVSLNQGDVIGAFRDINTAITSFDSADAYALLAQARAAHGDREDALAAYDQAIRRDRSNPLAYLGRGALREDQGRLADAVADYTRAIELQPELATARFNRGRAYLKLHRNEAAARDFNAIISGSSDPRLAEAARAQLAKLGGERSVPDSSGAQLYLQYQDRADLATVEKVGTVLEREGSKVLGAEYSPEQATYGDVRFFFPEDAANAEEVRREAEAALAGQGYPLSLQTMALDGSKFSNARPGLIEVWIPPLSRSTNSNTILNPPPTRGITSRLPAGRQ